jgi:phosphoserine phosphatase RsbU/P
VFHSDGIGDTVNEAGEFFGHDRICKLIVQHHELPSNVIADKILEEVDRFSNGAHPADDRTLVVLKVRGESGGGLTPS